MKYALPHSLNKFQTFIHVQKYNSKLNFKGYVMSNPVKDRTVVTDIQHSYLTNASLFNPPGNMSSSIKVVKYLVLKD